MQVCRMLGRKTVALRNVMSANLVDTYLDVLSCALNSNRALLGDFALWGGRGVRACVRACEWQLDVLEQVNGNGRVIVDR